MSKEKEITKDKFKEEIGEDATLYGEFVCSYHHWLPIEKQKEQAEKMQKITKNNNKARNNEINLKNKEKS